MDMFENMRVAAYAQERQHKIAIARALVDAGAQSARVEHGVAYANVSGLSPEVITTIRAAGYAAGASFVCCRTW